MEFEKELQKKLDDVADGVTHVQEKHASLEKKIDAVDFASMKEAQEKSSKLMEEIQAEQVKIDGAKTNERLFAIEKALTDGNGNSGKVTDEHKQSFYSYLRKGNVPSADSVDAFCSEVAKKSIIHGDDMKVQAYAKALVEGSNPDGGFFVTPDRSSAMIKRIFETSPMRSVCSVVTTTSNVFEMVLDDDEAACGWVGEVEDRDETDTPQVGLLSIPVHEVYAKPKATQTMLDDAGFDIEGWLQGKVVDKISRTENTAFCTGDGSKKPKGFLAYTAATTPNTYQRDAITQITATGTAGSIDEPDDLITLQNSLHDGYQQGAIFAGNRGTFSDIMKLADGEGRYLFSPTMLKDGTDRVLLGKSYMIFGDMAAIGTGNLPLAYGNFSVGYTVVDRFGIRVLRDPYSAKPYIEFYSTKRTGGGVTNFEAIKILVIN